MSGAGVGATNRDPAVSAVPPGSHIGGSDGIRALELRQVAEDGEIGVLLHVCEIGPAFVDEGDG